MAKDYRWTTVRDSQGRKQCRKCDHWLREDAFSRGGRTGDGFSSRCKSCVREDQRKRFYTLTPEDVIAMAHRQDGRCAVCRNELEVNFCVDHDHGCCPGFRSCGKCVRGLLCRSCNTGLGMFVDDPKVIKGALAYLLSYQSGSTGCG